MDTVAKVTQHIKENDRLISLFNMEIEETAPGMARVSMKVGPDHLNAARLCHGAALFALADVAFALAANCYGKMALAIEASMNYFRPVKEGGTVTVLCQEEFQGRRTGTYFATIKDQDGKKIAIFKATSFRVDEVPVSTYGRPV
jgi:acyl-CoA thioesterase